MTLGMGEWRFAHPQRRRKLDSSPHLAIPQPSQQGDDLEQKNSAGLDLHPVAPFNIASSHRILARRTQPL
jgi:hypothetical protein